jgi:hypothetical protein
VAGLVIVADRFTRIPSGLWLEIVLTVSFSSGFLGYFPYQFLR